MKSFSHLWQPRLSKHFMEECVGGQHCRASPLHAPAADEALEDAEQQVSV